MVLYLILEKLNAFVCSSNKHHDTDIAVKVQSCKPNGLNACVIVFSSSHVCDHFDPPEAEHVVILPQPKFVESVALQEDDLYLLSLGNQILVPKIKCFSGFIINPKHEICIKVLRIRHFYEFYFFISVDLRYIFHVVFCIRKNDIVVIVVQPIVDAYILRSQMLDLINVTPLPLDVLRPTGEGRRKGFKTNDLIYLELSLVLLLLDLFNQVYLWIDSSIVELFYP